MGLEGSDLKKNVRCYRFKSCSSSIQFLLAPWPMERLFNPNDHQDDPSGQNQLTNDGIQRKSWTRGAGSFDDAGFDGFFPHRVTKVLIAKCQRSQNNENDAEYDFRFHENLQPCALPFAFPNGLCRGKIFYAKLSAYVFRLPSRVRIISRAVRPEIRSQGSIKVSHNLSGRDWLLFAKVATMLVRKVYARSLFFRTTGNSYLCTRDFAIVSEIPYNIVS
jgi:hypothetical protein